ncbi:Squamosa promoter-binding-like protein [Quillaja saponaria]|uniref:Squamosa promoter-binding-like protein n=1 Tax=Quillaja saponaria TaxID=32244 RepID=A0AAD7QES3_QUISA|nr:Squamosa promoter-binding-like protein [Quillaja saponaria]
MEPHFSQPPAQPLYPPSQPVVAHRQRVSEMEVHPLVMEDPSSSLWDLSYLIDFTQDSDQNLGISLDSNQNLDISLDSDQNLEIPQPQELHTQEDPDRVRKRDPRLICSNFLSGHVPCACPELDEKLEEQEAGLPGKKRARTARASAGVSRCQVPGCQADIGQLKGYHRRHRVCLSCANASTVVLHGETKRYCQQCGKFHVLSDFDEGRRSCRRKLERHNNRRRRKSTDSTAGVEKEVEGVMQTEELNYDVEDGKDDSYLSSQVAEEGASLDCQNGQVTTLCSAPDTQNINGDSVKSFVPSGETTGSGGKNNTNFSVSPTYCDNRSAYSSPCPTGRISFKLYDWNPAEFPRRLRHQIFDWLANMPVELEGYIRPGCTILTAFVAMPKFMWVNLLGDAASYVHDFVVSPGRMLFGRGTMLIYLNNMVFRLMRDGVSLLKVKVEERAPRLHYVHPTYFEAGKPMEFVACGINLLQPKFRLLISFSGKYLEYDHCIASTHNKTGDSIACSFEQQLYKIYIPHTEPNVFGPAFIEVENESGLSNLIPVLIGDKEICYEMKILQQRFDASLISKRSQFAYVGYLCESCNASAVRQTTYSDLILDVGWLLKEPSVETSHKTMTSSQIERFSCLLDFLICNDSTIILEKIVRNLEILTENSNLNSVVNSTNDVDMRLLQKSIDHARCLLSNKHPRSGGFFLHSLYSWLRGYRISRSCSQDNMKMVSTITIQDTEIRDDGKSGVLASSTSPTKIESVPLLNGEVAMNVNLIREIPRKSCHQNISMGVLSTRPTVFVIASVAVCFGICTVLLHPHQVVKLTVSIRRCLFDYT